MLERFTLLDDLLAVGSHPHAPEHVEELARLHGVKSVVCLQSDQDLAARGLLWPVLWQLYTRHGIRVSRVPIRDFDKADLRARLDEAVREIERHVSAGRRTFVHCNAGVNRSPTVLMAWLVRHRGLSVADALEFVTDRHACLPYDDVVRDWARDTEPRP